MKPSLEIVKFFSKLQFSIALFPNILENSSASREPPCCSLLLYSSYFPNIFGQILAKVFAKSRKSINSLKIWLEAKLLHWFLWNFLSLLRTTGVLPIPCPVATYTLHPGWIWIPNKKIPNGSSGLRSLRSRANQRKSWQFLCTVLGLVGSKYQNVLK